eukprot:gene4970-6953_t
MLDSTFDSTFHGIDELKHAHYKRPGSLIGYTGKFLIEIEPQHPLQAPLQKEVIRGYAGYIPNLLETVGEPFIKSANKEQTRSLERKSINVEEKNYFREYSLHMDIMERYADAIESITSRGQSQELLLKIVQAKVSERVQSYADQLIYTRKLFESYRFENGQYMNEAEFCRCLEKMNVQFNDDQLVALFAFFDDDNDGLVEWTEFADTVVVYNPRSGTAVLPKMITTQVPIKQNEMLLVKSSHK